MDAHPMLKPLAVRVGLLLFCIAWTAFEAWHEPGSIWFWMFAGVTVYALVEFFISGKYRQKDVAPGQGGDAR